MVPKYKTYEERECIVCGDAFTTVTSNKRGRAVQICGAQSCRSILNHRNSRKEKACDGCGNLFMASRDHMRFCTADCMKYRHIDSCDQCGAEYNTAIIGKRKFCSMECRLAYQTEHNTVTLNCEHCEQPFERETYKIHGLRQYCSRTCLNADFAYRNYYGENNKYGPEWYSLRLRTFTFYNFYCQRCDEQFDIHGLQLHHIIPYRYFPNRDEANNENNLLPLCGPCHRQVHQENDEWYEENFVNDIV